MYFGLEVLSELCPHFKKLPVIRVSPTNFNDFTIIGNAYNFVG